MKKFWDIFFYIIFHIFLYTGIFLFCISFILLGKAHLEEKFLDVPVVTHL